GGQGGAGGRRASYGRAGRAHGGGGRGEMPRGEAGATRRRRGSALRRGKIEDLPAASPPRRRISRPWLVQPATIHPLAAGGSWRMRDREDTSCRGGCSTSSPRASTRPSSGRAWPTSSCENERSALFSLPHL